MGNKRIIPFLSLPTVSIILHYSARERLCLKSQSLLPAGQWAEANWWELPSSVFHSCEAGQDLLLTALSPLWPSRAQKHFCGGCVFSKVWGVHCYLQAFPDLAAFGQFHAIPFLCTRATLIRASQYFCSLAGFPQPPKQWSNFLYSSEDVLTGNL